MPCVAAQLYTVVPQAALRTTRSVSRSAASSLCRRAMGFAQGALIPRDARRGVSGGTTLRRGGSATSIVMPSASASPEDSPLGNKAATGTGDRYKLDGNTNGGLTIPTMLTLLRVAVIPVLVALYFRPEPWVPAACAGIFLAAAITDWLDGYLARKLKQASAFGAFLDPVADKLMVTAALVLLCTIQPAGPSQALPWLVPTSAIVITAREITVSALREWASAAGGEAHRAVAVNWVGKWKTAFQMTALTLLLFFRDAVGATGLTALGVQVGTWLLAAATLLTLWSLVVYMRNAMKYML